MPAVLLTKKEYELFLKNDGETLETIRQRIERPSERGTKLVGKKITPLSTLYILYTGKINIFKKIPVRGQLTISHFSLLGGRLQVKFEEIDELLPWESECFNLPKARVTKVISPKLTYVAGERRPA